jgi:D-serine deaminase-like pyridoxal phosphate-dependent protein
MNIEDLDTPVAIVDLDIMEANIMRAQGYLDRHGIKNRPHIKTHKIPAIAKLQMEAGAVGITCQKLSEAEIMIYAGLTDIFIPYNLVGERKLTRLTRLMSKAQLRVTADSIVTIEGLAKAAQRAGKELAVLVEFDSGAQRCGVQTPEEAVNLALMIANSPGLRFGGLMTYPTNDTTDSFVCQAESLLAKEGLEVEIVSGGGTNQLWQAHEHPEVTEHRAGMYIFGDRYTLKGGGVRLEDCAFKVISTVVSQPTADRGILDGGSKTFSSDNPGLEGFGLILEYPEATVYAQSEEHGHVDFSRCAQRPMIGERVTVIPNHCCVVTNLFDELIGIRKGIVELTWTVAARGAIQ